MKTFRKIFSIVLCSLIFIGIISSDVNKVEAASYSIEADPLFEQIFDLDGLMWSTFDRGHFITVHDSEYGDYEAYCIEADDPIPDSETYSRLDGYGSYKSSRDVLLYWYRACRSWASDYRFTNIGYYGVQLAIWGKIAGQNPKTVLEPRILPGCEEVAEPILYLADRLYREAPDYASEPVIIYEEYPSNTRVPSSGYNAQKQSRFVKTESGMAYWSTPLIFVRAGENNMSGNVNELVTSITLSNLNTTSQLTLNDIKIVDSAGHSVTTLSPTSKQGNGFYIWIPMATTSGIVTEPGSFTVTLNSEYEWLDAFRWDPADTSYQSIMSLGLMEDDTSFSFPVSWDGIDVPTNETGTIITKKIGRWYTTSSEETFVSSDGTNWTYYPLNISDNSDQGLSGINFQVGILDGPPAIGTTAHVTNPHLRSRTYLDGTLEFTDIPLNQDSATYVALIEEDSDIFEIDAIDEIVDDVTGDTFKVVKYYKFDPSDGAGWNVIDRSDDPTKWITNGVKTIKITGVKEDVNTGEKLAGAVFQVINTKDIIAPNPDSSTGYAVVKAGSVIAIGETDSTGTVYLGEFIDDQDYLVQEVKAPEGYLLNSEKRSELGTRAFGDLTDADKLYAYQADACDPALGETSCSIIDDVKNYTLTFRNEQKPLEYVIKKIDADSGEALGGAIFGLFLNGEYVSDATSAEGTGYAVFEVPAGSYLLKELKAPDGYVIPDELKEGQIVVITEDTVGTIYRIENEKTEYTPVTAQLNLRKVLSGDNPEAAATFRYNVYYNGAIVKELTTLGAGSATYSVTFSEPGSYSFLLEEQNGHLDGYTYDTAVWEATYVVTGNEETGELTVANPTYRKDGVANAGPIVFTNNYKKPEEYDEDAKATITVLKKITGNSTENETFYFDITEQKEGGQTITKSITGSGSVSIELKRNTVGSEIYTISERNLTAAQINKGWKKDNSVFTVTFTVTDVDDDGVLEAKVTIKKNGIEVSKIEFINSYSGTVTCKAGYHLKNGVCVKDDDGCKEGYHYDEKKMECVKDETVCKDGYKLKNGVCVKEEDPSPKTGLDNNKEKKMHSFVKGSY